MPDGRRWAGCAALIGLVALLAGGAPAAPGAGSRRGLEAQQGRLEEIRRQLDQARERASAARVREVSLLAELERLDRTLATKRAAVQQLDRRVRHVESEIETLEGRRGRVAEHLVSQRAGLSARLDALARLSTAPETPHWFRDQSAVARRRAVADLVRLVHRDVGRLAHYDETAEQLARRQAALSRARRELVRLRQAVEAERRQVMAEGERRRALLSGVREDRAMQERMAAELQEAARRLESLVQQLARRAPARRALARPPEPGRPPGPAVGLGRERGQLVWPVDGRVVGEFGPEVHPRFGTEIVRTGLDIEAPEGTPIRAVAAGRVAYRGWLRGYGNLVVLDHGDGYHTLYAHASEVLVDTGEQVSGGAVIGRVGDTGSVEGARLRFEVRYQGRAEDPRLWLRRRP